MTHVMRFLFDEGIPDPARLPLEALGHEVILHRHVLPQGAPDDAVCATALRRQAILVAMDADMKAFARRYGGGGGNERFKGLNLLRLRCAEVQAEQRLAQALSLIEHEWDYAIRKRARRLWIEIEAHRIHTYR